MKPILLLLDHWHDQEEITGQPLAGSRFFILRSMLSAAGISLDDCEIANVFNVNTTDIIRLCGPKTQAIKGYPAVMSGKYIDAQYEPHLEALAKTIARHDPNLIIALGPAALWALTGLSGQKKYRGTPIAARSGHKVLATWSPEQVMRQWPLRPIVIADLEKAKHESTSREITRPSRRIWIEPSIADIEQFYKSHILPATSLSCDIETAGGTITEIGYAPSAELALVIPFLSRRHTDGNYWRTFAEEKRAWDIVRLINTTKPLFGQNFQYDMQYLWKTVGIPAPLFCDDTMLLHHTLQPEMQKGLGFLGSIYTSESAWKFMRHDNAEHYKQGEE